MINKDTYTHTLLTEFGFFELVVALVVLSKLKRRVVVRSVNGYYWEPSCEVVFRFDGQCSPLRVCCRKRLEHSLGSVNSMHVNNSFTVDYIVSATEASVLWARVYGTVCHPTCARTSAMNSLSNFWKHFIWELVDHGVSWLFDLRNILTN